VSRGDFLTQKVSRRERDYGLPRLTVDEFAREVGVEPDAITAWLATLLYRKIIRPSQWSRWTNNTEPISDAVIGLFLVQRLEAQGEISERQPLRPVETISKKNSTNSGKRGARS